jgi:hypothetical protein
MLRALLVILAILSAVLGVALGLWLMYVVTGLLVTAAAGVWLLGLKGKFDIARPDTRGYAPAATEDLGALGILEIRPKGAAALVEESQDAADNPEGLVEPAGRHSKGRQQSFTFEPEGRVSSADTQVHEPMPVERNGMASQSVPPSGTPTARRPSVRERKSSQYQVLSSSGGVDGNVILPCLESLCAALDANTVCLLGSEAGGKGHRIHAMVSRNAYARAGGELTPGNGMRWSSSRYVTVERAADATWDPYDLQYYRETIAVKELAHVAVPSAPGSRRYLLIVDSMYDGVLDNIQANQILEKYATLVGALVIEEPAGSDDAEPVHRPRREIIAEEMDEARASKSPMALALVMLNRAEEITARERLEVVDGVEAAFKARIEASAKDLRVERFGDLMLGVFVSSPVAKVEDWAIEVHGEFEKLGDEFEGGVSIGAAMLTDRHTTPEQLRADAAAALQEAVKSGVCTILE